MATDAGGVRAAPRLRAQPDRAHGARLPRRRRRDARARSRAGPHRRAHASTSARCAAGWPSSRRWARRARRWRAGRPPCGCSPPGRSAPVAPTPTPAPSLGSPKAHKTAAARAERRPRRVPCSRPRPCGPTTAAPVGLRDVAILELLYATGIRVGELCGLDVDDVDRGRRVRAGVRQGPQGAHRAVRRAGRPGARTLARSRAPALSCPGPGPALFLGARGRRIDQRAVRTLVHARLADVPDAPDMGPHGLRHTAATHLLEGGADLRTRAGAARARLAGDHADLHPRHHRPAAPGLPAGPPARLTDGSRGSRRPAPCGRRAARRARPLPPPAC